MRRPWPRGGGGLLPRNKGKWYTCGISLPVEHNVVDENVKLLSEVIYVLNIYCCLFKIHVV
jgi:hypothetical protein